MEENAPRSKDLRHLTSNWLSVTYMHDIPSRRCTDVDSVIETDLFDSRRDSPGTLL